MSDWKIISFSGCSVQDFETDYSFIVQQAIGFGFPPVSNISIPYGILDGNLFQRTRIEAQTFTLAGYLAGSSVADLHTLRKNLISAIKRDRVAPEEPVVIQYTGGASTVQASAYYDAGLELGNVTKYSELGIGLRFFVPDPKWESPTSTSATLEIQKEASAANYLIRDENGVWSGSLGTNGDVLSCEIHPTTGHFYVSGLFTQLGGFSTNYIAYWDGLSWNALGSGLGGFTVTQTFGPDGTLYVGGQFVTAGGSAASRVASWDGTTWSDIGAAAVDDTVWTMTVSPCGDLVIGGQFVSVAGSAASRIARWDGDTWSPVGSAIDTQVRDVAYSLDSKLYATGPFTTVGAIAASYIAKWDETLQTWSSVGSGLDARGWHLEIGSDGLIYTTGCFNNVNGTATPACGVGVWNGAVWSSLGAGMSKLGFDATAAEYGKTLAFDNDGRLLLGGKFTAVGGKTVDDGYGIWNGSEWMVPGLDLPSTATVNVIRVASDNSLFMGFSTAGCAIVPGQTTVTNDGTSETFPVFTASGPGRLRHLKNWTTGQEIFFSDLDLSAGETVTLDLRFGAKTFVSDFRGNILNQIQPGSNLVDFHLSPGSNSIGLYIDNSSASANIKWTDRYWGIDI